MKITKRELKKLIQESVRSLVEENAGKLGEVLNKNQIKTIMNDTRFGESLSPRDVTIFPEYILHSDDFKYLKGNMDDRGVIIKDNGDVIAVIVPGDEKGFIVIDEDGKAYPAKTTRTIIKILEKLGIDFTGDETTYQMFDNNGYNNERRKKQSERVNTKRDTSGLDKIAMSAVRKLADKKILSDDAKSRALAEFIVELTKKWDEIYNDVMINDYGSIDVRDWDAFSVEDDSEIWGPSRTNKYSAKKNELLKKRNKLRKK